MARAAVILLIDQVRRQRAGEPVETTHRLLPFTLVKRDSTAIHPPER